MTQKMVEKLVDLAWVEGDVYRWQNLDEGKWSDLVVGEDQRTAERVLACFATGRGIS